MTQEAARRVFNPVKAALVEDLIGLRMSPAAQREGGPV
jgi:hypothetical protein